MHIISVYVMSEKSPFCLKKGRSVEKKEALQESLP